MKYILVFILLIQSCVGFSQYSTKNKKAINYFQMARKAYHTGNFEGAVDYCNHALEKDENFVEARMLMGDVYLDSKQYEKSVEQFSIVLKANPDINPMLYVRTAQVELKLMQYDAALEHLNAFYAYGEMPPQLKPKVAILKANAEFGVKAIKNPVPFNPINLGPGTNTRMDDYHPSITVDGKTIVFTRKELKGRYDNGRPIYREDLYFSNKTTQEWGRAINYQTPINTPRYNEGSSCISHDGKYLFFTACERKGGKGSCDIYVSERQGNKWSVPVNMGDRINTNAWESHPSLAPDGKTLYFTSNRPGGKGDSDIWRSTIGEDGFWGEPENLSINTPGKDMTASVHGDGYTLFFSSNGWPGMGGSDIYVVRYDANGNLGEPLNLGYPINTPEDEFAMIADPQGRVAYYSSEMKGGYGGLDLYQFDLPEHARPRLTQSLVGNVFHAESKAKLGASVELIDLGSGKVVAQTNSDDNTGEFLAALPSGRDYALNVSKEGYLFYSENFSLKDKTAETTVLKVPLSPLEKGKELVLNNVFFETAKADLKAESKTELNKLVKLLETNPELSIEIGGHTDNVGNASKNMLLSKQRAEAVKNYLVKNGVTSQRLTAKGYGANKPVASNDTESGRAKNRRTEITIL